MSVARRLNKAMTQAARREQRIPFGGARSGEDAERREPLRHIAPPRVTARHARRLEREGKVNLNSDNNSFYDSRTSNLIYAMALLVIIGSCVALILFA